MNRADIANRIDRWAAELRRQAERQARYLARPADPDALPIVPADLHDFAHAMNALAAELRPSAPPPAPRAELPAELRPARCPGCGVTGSERHLEGCPAGGAL